MASREPTYQAVGGRNPNGCSSKFRQKVRANESVAVVAASQFLAAEASVDCPPESDLPHPPALLWHRHDRGRRQLDTPVTSSGGNRGTTLEDPL